MDKILCPMEMEVSCMSTGNIPETYELGTPPIKDKIVGPNGVHYRGVPLYFFH